LLYLGKTSLIKQLLNLDEFKNSHHINQDEFFYKKESGALEFIADLNSFNYDCLKAIDSQKFYNSYQNCISSMSHLDYLFIDGFLLFFFRDIKYDRKFFFTLTKNECKERRSKRNYKTVGTLNYFEQLVWPNYVEYFSFCENTFSNIVYLNGADSLENNVNLVTNELKNM
jgi:uridine kinase